MICMLLTFSVTNLLYSLIYIAYGVTVLGIVAVILSENRNPVRSLAWVTIMLLLPALGLVLYIFFGRSIKNKHLISRRSRNALKMRTIAQEIDEDALPLNSESRQQIRLARGLVGAQYYPDNNIQIYTDGATKFKDLESDLKAAKKYICLQYYIFEDDNLGQQISDIFILKARQGVEVRVIYDGAGSFPVQNSFFKRMRSNGVKVAPFMRITFPQFANHINWRNHRKVTVIDGEIGYIGGMNIADRYVNGVSFGVWRDTHIRITGPAVEGLLLSFAIDWKITSGEMLNKHIAMPDQHPTGQAGIQIVSSGPTAQWQNIEFLFIKAIGNAHKRIYIQTPYFLPTESLLSALQTAALAKVDVRIMFPRKCDSRMLRWASRSYVSECIQAGIKVYLYDNGMLHAKTVVIDDEFCSVGSTNFDFRSFEHNFECNAMIYGHEINEQMATIFEADLDYCTRVRPAQWRHRHWTGKVMESIVRLLSPIL